MVHMGWEVGRQKTKDVDFVMFVSIRTVVLCTSDQSRVKGAKLA